MQGTQKSEILFICLFVYFSWLQQLLLRLGAPCRQQSERTLFHFDTAGYALLSSLIWLLFLACFIGICANSSCFLLLLFPSLTRTEWFSAVWCREDARFHVSSPVASGSQNHCGEPTVTNLKDRFFFSEPFDFLFTSVIFAVKFFYTKNNKKKKAQTLLGSFVGVANESQVSAQRVCSSFTKRLTSLSLF